MIRSPQAAQKITSFWTFKNNKTKHARTEQRREARGRRLGKREGTKRSSCNAGLTQHSGGQPPPCPAGSTAPALAPCCQHSLESPSGARRALNPKAASPRTALLRPEHRGGAVQAAACLLLLNVQKNQRCFGNPPCSPGATLPAPASRLTAILGFPSALRLCGTPGASRHPGGPHARVPTRHSRVTHVTGCGGRPTRPTGRVSVDVCVCLGCGGGSPEATAVCWQREAPGAQRGCLVPTQGRTTAPGRASPRPGAGSPQNPARAAAGRLESIPPPSPKQPSHESPVIQPSARLIIVKRAAPVTETHEY